MIKDKDFQFLRYPAKNFLAFLKKYGLLKSGGTMTGNLVMSGAAINESPYVTVASATTTDVFGAASNNVAISGTTAITGFTTAAAGITRRVRATGAFSLTYNATSMILPTEKNIQVRANDTFTVTSLGSGNAIVTNYLTSDGRKLPNAVNNQTGTSYTFQLADVGNNVVANNAAASIYTLPQTSNIPIPVGTEIDFLNEGVGTVTFQREGGDDIIGNTTCATGVSAILKKISATSWKVFGGTKTINMIGIQASFDISTSQTKEVCFIAPSNITLLGIRQIVNGVIGTAGSFTIHKNGIALSGLTAITPSTIASYTPATGTDSDNVLVRGDVITCVANGTLVGVTSLKIQLDLTQPL